MSLNLRRRAVVVGVCGAISISATAWANTAGFPPTPADSAAAAATSLAPSAPAGAAAAGAAAPDSRAPSASLASDAAVAAAKVPPYSSWDVAYAQARAAMARGDFAHAGSSFTQLAESARTPQEHALCVELADLADRWAEAGLTLAPTRAGSEAAGVRLNERTSDEISILYLNSVLYGLGTGAWLAVVSEPNDSAGIILPALGLAGAAAGAVALIDHTSHLGYGVPASAVTGLYIGLEEGVTWTLWNQAKAAYFDEWQGSTVATVIWGSASIGAITGAVVGASAGTTPGRASYVGSTALWGGLLTGLAVAAVTGDDRGQRDDASLLGAAVGTNLGTVAGMLSAGPVSPSAARVRFIDLGGIAGGLLTGGLYVSAADSNNSDSTLQGLFGVTALGVAGGLLTASLLTRSMAPDLGVSAEAKPAPANVQPTLLPVRGGMQLGVLGKF